MAFKNEKAVRRKMTEKMLLHRSGYVELSKNQEKDLELVNISPSDSKKFHRNNILFQIFHLNAYRNCYDHWDKAHKELLLPRSSLRNAILDKRLEWDCKKAEKNLSEGKPHFSDIKLATFPPVRIITQIKEKGELRIVEYLQLENKKSCRVVYVWRERNDMKGEYNARIISLHPAGDKRGKNLVESTLLSNPFFVDGITYAIWFPHVITKKKSTHAVFALYEYPQHRTKEIIPFQVSYM